MKKQGQEALREKTSRKDAVAIAEPKLKVSGAFEQSQTTNCQNLHAELDGRLYTMTDVLLNTPPMCRIKDYDSEEITRSFLQTQLQRLGKTDDVYKLK